MGARRNSGRKVIPMEIKKVKGTYFKDRDPGTLPPSPDRPVSPEMLNARAKEIFDTLTQRLSDTGRATDTFTEIQALCAMRLEEVEHLSGIIRVMGMFYVVTNRNGEEAIRKHPAVEFRETALRHAHGLLAELALTHVASQKVGPVKPKPTVNEFEGF